MRRYRTEIVIPADRAVILHLPPHLPEGRAVVIVEVDESPGPASQEHDLDHHDIEWWEEFEGPLDADEGSTAG